MHVPPVSPDRWRSGSAGRTTVTAGLYPVVPDDCSAIGATLSWCEGAEEDLDFFIFRPGPDGLIRPTEANAVYWGMLADPPDYHLRWSPTGNAPNEAYVQLEVDDVGRDDDGRRTFGPETMYISAKRSPLPPGKYALMVMAYTGNPFSTLRGDCATVQLYSPRADGGLYESIGVGAKGALGNWWHVVTIEVAWDPSINASSVTYHVVDEMLSSGPSVSDSGAVTGGFAPAADLNKLPAKRSVLIGQNRIDLGGELQCGTFVQAGFSVRSAVTSQPIQGAYFQIGSTDATKVYIDAWPYRWDRAAAQAVGGYPLIEGQHTVYFTASQYSTQARPPSHSPVPGASTPRCWHADPFGTGPSALCADVTGRACRRSTSRSPPRAARSTLRCSWFRRTGSRGWCCAGGARRGTSTST